MTNFRAVKAAQWQMPPDEACKKLLQLSVEGIRMFPL
jgi:hypothetical protein